eukprot:1268646-Pyramimonas_sp.AAC.1
MRLILTKAGLDNVSFNVIKGVCDTCRECRAWDKPGHAFMPCTGLPCQFIEEVECDLMFYRKKHHTFHLIDRCIRDATGMEIADKTVT